MFTQQTGLPHYDQRTRLRCALNVDRMAPEPGYAYWMVSRITVRKGKVLRVGKRKKLTRLEIQVGPRQVPLTK